MTQAGDGRIDRQQNGSEGAHVLRRCHRTSLGDAATEAGLSAPRLRTLARETIGVPLVRVRQWQRLRTAIAALPHHRISEVAAHAAFADQAHLTRTAQRMLGRSPASLR
ncbi:helix-turn-helix domain-containing protein [Nocardia sp. bgisy134]|uniref:helix-turn-helix domain-containing protein n=1 Tax=unclassified Nocardia TaxID=2637762 RepID=UPI003D705CC4